MMWQKKRHKEKKKEGKPEREKANPKEKFGYEREKNVMKATGSKRVKTNEWFDEWTSHE